MKYALGVLTIIMMPLFSLMPTQAEDSLNEKSFSLKQEIEESISNGKIYTHAIDVFAEGLSHTPRKLTNTLDKVVKLKKKLDAKSNKTSKERSVYKLVVYIEYQLLLQSSRIEDEALKYKRGEYLQISEEKFEESFGNQSQGVLENTLNDIYVRYKNIDQVQASAILNEKKDQVQVWYNTNNEAQRDITRIADINALSTAIQNYYKTHNTYPEYASIISELESYTDIPKDPFGGIQKNNCFYGYFYEVWDNGQNYRLSTCLESNDNRELAVGDGGIDPSRYETGTSVGYAGKGYNYTLNTDIHYFSLVNQESEGGPIQGYASWANLPKLNGTEVTPTDELYVLLSLEHQEQNPWIYENERVYHVMNMIAAALDSYFVNGNILSVIKHEKKYVGEDVYIGGELDLGRNYRSGKIDYQELGLNEDFIRDSIGHSFLLSYVNKGWGHYQIVGFTLEREDGKDYKKVLLRGTYNPRNLTLTRGVDYEQIDANTLEFNTVEDIWLFKRGEGINRTHVVTMVDYETKRITLDTDVSEMAKIVFDEPAGLIVNPETGNPYVAGERFLLD